MAKRTGLVLGFGLLGFVQIFTGCGTVGSVVHWRMDGVVPVDYYQNLKDASERLVYVQPVLTPGQWFSNLYIITNPEDIQKAEDKLGNPGTLPLKDIEKALKEFAPVKIQSTTDSGRGNGIAVFRLPPTVDKLFYVYIRYRQDINYTSDYTTDVYCETMRLLPGTDNIYIGFSEKEGSLVTSVRTDPAGIKAAYDATTGIYGWYLSANKEQEGFIEIGLKVRNAILSEQSKAEALKAGVTLEVISGYYTYHQETREYEITDIGVRGASRKPGDRYDILDANGKKIGEARGPGKTVVRNDPIRRETRTETVDVPVRNELAFELYQGSVKVASGTTPAKISGLAIDTEYTLRWVSPVDGERWIKFTKGLDRIFGIPGTVHESIK